MMLPAAMTIAIASLSACAPQVAGPQSPFEMQQRLRDEAPTNGERTIVEDQAALERLRGNSGLTLQWISWDWRGQLDVTQRGDLLHLSGVQDSKDAPAGTKDISNGRLELDGDVLAIDEDSFMFRGRIVITDVHGEESPCVRDGVVTFLITRNRKYWRLQDMVECDGLTDYVDVYF